MLLFYTFCCDIKKHSKLDLIKALFILVQSIHKHCPNYCLLCFSNFKEVLSKKIPKKYNIKFKNYYDKKTYTLYNDKWLNLSFNKINIYKDLYDKYNKDFIWIDLDTIVSRDLTFINDLSNVFIIHGGHCIGKNTLFHNSSISVVCQRYIQGNFWKLNINLYYDLIQTLNYIIKNNLQLKWDLQDLFNYYYISNNSQKMNILGLNIKHNSLNGLAMWAANGNSHPNEPGLNNLYYENSVLKSNFYPNNEIYIVSFVFNNLKELWHKKKFNELFMS